MDLVALVDCANRFCLLGSHSGQIFEPEQPALLLVEVSSKAGDGAAIETLRAIARERLQRAGQVGLFKQIARLEWLPVFEECPQRTRIRRKLLDGARMHRG